MENQNGYYSGQSADVNLDDSFSEYDMIRGEIVVGDIIADPNVE